MGRSSLSEGERIVAVCAGLLVILSKIRPWARYTVEGFGGQDVQTASVRVWEPGAFNLLPKVAIILAILALVIVGMRALGLWSARPPGTRLLYLSTGLVSTTFLLITVVTGPTGFIESADFKGLEEAIEATGGIELHKGRGVMLFVALILAAAMTYGGYLHDERKAEDPSAPAS